MIVRFRSGSRWQKGAEVETNRRTIVKAVTYQLMGLIVMTVIGTFFTGSPSRGGAIALVSAVVGAAGYILHEKLWAMVPWGWRPSSSCAEPESGSMPP